MQQRRIQALSRQPTTAQLNLRQDMQTIPGILTVETSSAVPSSIDPSGGNSQQAFHHSTEIDSSDDKDSDEDNGVLPRIGYTSDSSGTEVGEVKDDRGRTRIRPTGRKGFEGSDQVLRNAYSIVHCYYKGPWRKWSMVPEEQKKIWWEEFKNRYFWKDKHAHKVHKNWRAKCSEHLRTTFCVSREKGKRPDFIDPEYWVEMLKGWEEDDTFKRQSEMNKRNRASEAPNGIGLFVGGRKPLVKIRAEYERKHGKRMSQEKLVEKAYRKKNGEWSSDKVPITLDKYRVLCERFKESHPEGMTEEDANNLWFEAAGGRKKGEAFCLASFGNSVSNLRNSGCIGPSQRASNLNASEIDELRTRIEEDVRKKVESELQKSMEERMQQLLRIQREEDATIYQRMLAMQQDRYVSPTPQIDTSCHSFAHQQRFVEQLPLSPLVNQQRFVEQLSSSSLTHQPRFVEQLPASTHLFDSLAFSAVRPNQNALPNSDFEGGFGGRSAGQSSG